MVESGVAFETASGRAVPAVDAAGMREVDRIAVEDVGLRLLQMMENAGRTLAATARSTVEADTGPGDGAGPVVVLAGSGGNGGGGICAARHLANHADDVRLVLDRDPDELSGAAATQYDVLAETGAPVDWVGVGGGDAGADTDTDTDANASTDADASATTASEDADEALAGAGLVVDALVGYGLDGALAGRTATLVDAVGRVDAPVVSLDVPSGIDATTGETAGPAVAAARTLTLALPKTGLGRADETGALHLADIGIPRGVYERAGIDYDQPFDGRPSVRLRVRDA